MAPYGKAQHGKQEIAQGNQPDRHGAPHRLRDARARSPHVTHLLERLHRGPQQPPPGAVQHLLAVCPPEHGVGRRQRRSMQSKLAVEGRAYPLFRYDPDKGIDLRASASASKATRRWTQDWPAYTLEVPGRARQGGRAWSCR
ncbi:MAG: hypothetical protein MZV65_17700 [Chromatiales bacterium]|nr:hypothetical protein [Chromatiales bacterium]